MPVHCPAFFCFINISEKSEKASCLSSQVLIRTGGTIDARGLYEYEGGHTWASYWPEVLAVFAVNQNLNGDDDVIVIDREKADLLIDTFRMMHRIESEVEEVEVPADSGDGSEESEDRLCKQSHVPTGMQLSPIGNPEPKGLPRWKPLRPAWWLSI